MPSILRGDQTATFVVLSVMYAAMSAYTFDRLRKLHKVAGPLLDTQKLFVVTLFLTSVLRTLSFVGLTCLSVQSIKYGDTDDDDNDGEVDEDEDFYEKAVLVMFDLPDYTIITGYLLLVIVHAETFLYARRHWLDPVVFRRRWVVWYLGINTALYGIQLTLYSLLFLPNVNQAVLFQLIFITLAAVSFLLPLAVASLFLYLTFKFSAFPFRSEEAAARLKKVGFVQHIWTAGRFLWGGFAMFAVWTSWAGNVNDNSTAYSIVLICLFLCSEIIPFVLALDSEILDVLLILSSNYRDPRGTISSVATAGALSGAPTDRDAEERNDLEEPLLSETSFGFGLEDMEDEAKYRYTNVEQKRLG